MFGFNVSYFQDSLRDFFSFGTWEVISLITISWISLFFSSSSALVELKVYKLLNYILSPVSQFWFQWNQNCEKLQFFITFSDIAFRFPFFVGLIDIKWFISIFSLNISHLRATCYCFWFHDTRKFKLGQAMKFSNTQYSRFDDMCTPWGPYGNLSSTFNGLTQILYLVAVTVLRLKLL